MWRNCNVKYFQYYKNAFDIVFIKFIWYPGYDTVVFLYFRFHHYLDSITLSLKDKTMSTLATTFSP